MYVTLKITEQTYEAVRNLMKAARVGDYYSTLSGASGALLPSDSPEPVAAIADRRVTSWLYDKTINHGYTVSVNGAMYCTSALNVHGVYKTDSGDHVAFYWGRRSRSSDLHNTLHEVGVDDPCALAVVEYQTEGPADMLWYEDRAAYTLRKGDNAIIDAMSSREWDLDVMWCQDVWRHLNELRRANLAQAAEKRRAINKKVSEASHRRSAAES